MYTSEDLQKVYREAYEEGARTFLWVLRTGFVLHFGTYTKDATVKISEVFEVFDRIIDEMEKGANDD